MREIKFQIYWIAGNEMLYDTNNDLEFRDNENYWITDLSDAINHPESYKVRQYTGLKDKNGVEVYESDIVEQEFTELGSTEGIFNNPLDDMTSFIGEIKMYEGAWWIDSGSWAIPLFSELSPNEVLGNRYENPELLKE